MTIYRVVDNQFYYGQVIQNVVHFKHGSSDPLTMDQLATEFRDTWVNQVRTMQNTLLKHTVIQVRMLESQFAQAQLTTNLPGTFGSSDEWKVTQCHILRLQAATIGKHGQGRVYVAGQPFNAAQSGIITQVNINLWNTRLANILAVFGPSGSSAFRLVIAPRTNPSAAVDVVRMSIAPTEGWQRRRNIGVGT